MANVNLERVSTVQPRLVYIEERLQWAIITAFVDQHGRAYDRVRRLTDKEAVDLGLEDE